MSSLKVWLPSRSFLDLFSRAVSWRKVVSVLSLGLVGRLLWQQYGVLRYRNRPPTDLGLPIVGKTLEIFRVSLEGVGMSLMKGRRSLLINFLGNNAVLVDWPLYMEHLNRLEIDGEMEPAYPPTIRRVAGPNSIIMLPGGRGHARHKRLRNKILASLGPKAVLGLLPEMIDLARRTLDAMASETETKGFSSFAGYASTLAAEVSTLPITAGLEGKVHEEVGSLLDTIMVGTLSMPINLGRFTSWGRAMIARQRLGAIIKDLMMSPNLSRRSIISDLVQSSEDGAGFQAEEMVDTVATLLLAGKLTTADALPALLAHLHQHRDWVQRIAQEPLHFQGCEDDSATLRFIRETLRVCPPAGAFRRCLINKSQTVDMGEHGVVPPGTTFAVHLSGQLEAMGSNFDPERWTPEVIREKFIGFGGPQPHQCIGKGLALMELQVFARVLCAEYEFEALDTERVVQAPYFTRTYRNGLRMKVSRKRA